MHNVPPGSSHRYFENVYTFKMWFSLMIDKVKYLWLHAIYQSNVWFQEVLPLSTFYSERVYPIWTLHSSNLSPESFLYSLLALHVPYGNWILLHCSTNNSKPISVNIKVANVKSNLKNNDVSENIFHVYEFPSHKI